MAGVGVDLLVMVSREMPEDHFVPFADLPATDLGIDPGCSARMSHRGLPSYRLIHHGRDQRGIAAKFPVLLREKIESPQGTADRTSGRVRSRHSQ